MNNLIVTDWIKYLESIKENSSNTIISYQRDITNFLQYIFYRKNNLSIDIDEIKSIDIHSIDEDFISKINVRDIISYINYSDKNLNNSASTRNRKISSLNSFFSYMFKVIGVIDSNPIDLIDAPRIPKRLPHALELNEVKQLLEAVLSNKDEYYAIRDYAILMVFLNTGIRLSELVNIKTNHIVNNEYLRVIGKGNKERNVFLNSSVTDSIRTYMDIRPDSELEFLFLNKNGSNNLGQRGVQYLVSKYLKKCGLGGKYSPHSFRHTAATLLYQYGDVDIRTLQLILGHESVSTTQIYTHVSDKKLKEAVELNPIKNLNIKNKE